MHPVVSSRGAPAPRRRVAAFLAAAALFLVAVLPAAAQQAGAVAGVVVSSGGAPLAGTRVTAGPGGAGALTDARGGFRIPGVPAGSVTLRAERIGYAAAEQSLEVPAGGEVRARLVLAERAMELEGVVVSATREARLKSQTAASVGTVSGAEIREVRPAHPAEIVGRVPGVWVSNAGGEGHMTAIRQPRSTKPMYLFLEDGVPTRSTGFFNHNALYEVNLPQAERIEVLKGPATALYGSDAIGGVIGVETRPASLAPQLEGSLERGSGAWTRLLLTASGTAGSDGVRGDLNVTHSDGYRDAMGYDRVSGTVRWDRYLPGSATLKTVATYSTIDQTDGSTVTAADYRARSAVNYNPIAFRRVRALRLSAALEKPFGAATVSLTPFVRANSMELLPSWQLSYDPTVYTTGHRSLGLLARARSDLPFWGGEVVAGVDLENSPGSRREDRISVTRVGSTYAEFARGDRVYDYDVAFRGVSPYVQAELEPLRDLRVSLGVRYDRVGYAYDTHLAPTSAGRWRVPADTTLWYGQVSPKLGLTWTPAREAGVFASYRHGFRAPSEGQVFRQGSSDRGVDLRPVDADSWEAGVRGVLGGRVSYEASAYRMDVRDDILTYLAPDGAGGFNRVNLNAGHTRHRGVELGVGAELAVGLRVDAAWSSALHTYEEWELSATESYAGMRMESAPRELVNARLAWAPAFAPEARAGVEWVRVGSYFLDPANTRTYPGHDLLNLRLSVPLTRALELDGRVSNLLDERYAEGASFDRFQGELFTPGAPRALSLAVRYRWSGEGGR